MSFRFLIRDAGCFPKANVCYIEGEFLSDGLLRDTPAIALTNEGTLPVFVRNIAFVDPPDANSRFFTLTIDPPDYDINLLKGAMLAPDDNYPVQKYDPLTDERSPVI